MTLSHSASARKRLPRPGWQSPLQGPALSHSRQCKSEMSQERSPTLHNSHPILLVESGLGHGFLTSDFWGCSRLTPSLPTTNPLLALGHLPLEVSPRAPAFPSYLKSLLKNHWAIKAKTIPDTWKTMSQLYRKQTHKQDQCPRLTLPSMSWDKFILKIVNTQNSTCRLITEVL